MIQYNLNLITFSNRYKNNNWNLSKHEELVPGVQAQGKCEQGNLHQSARNKTPRFISLTKVGQAVEILGRMRLRVRHTVGQVQVSR